MKHLPAVLILSLCLAPVASRAETEPKVLREVWYESRAEGGKLGCMHLRAEEVERAGRKLIRTTLRDEMSYLRSGDPYNDAQEQETLETFSGEVVELSYSVTLSKKQRLRIRGEVKGRELHLCVLDDQGKPTEFTQIVPWDPLAVGLYAQETFFENHPPRPGDIVVIKGFNVYANRVLAMTYCVLAKEATQVGMAKQELVRVEASYPRDAYLTPTTIWLDSSGRVVKMQEDDSTLFGSMTRELTTKEVATAAFKPKVRDKEAPVLVNKPISIRRGRPSLLRVRVSLAGDEDPGTLFAEDGRQRVVAADKEAVELRLLARQPTIPLPVQALLLGAPSAAGDEYLHSNFFIRSDDPLVRKLANEALGENGENKEPREKARLIKRWVRTKVRGNYEIPFATADEVARSLEGDCSEMGMLAAAMARAVGVPSRVAFGLVYDAENKGFGGHLWTEVFLDGQWQPLDATGVLDSLNAAYIRIASYSMKDVLNPDELVAVRRAFTGEMKVEVVEAR